MAVAGPSRRISRRREPSQDDIETPISQPRTQDPVEDDDEDERPKKPKVKKEKADLRDPESILASLGNPALDTASLAKLNGITKDWGSLRQGPYTNAFALVVDVAPSLAEFAEGDEGKKGIEQLDAIMRRLIDTEQEFLAHEQALGDLREAIAKKEEVPNIIEHYETTVKQKVAAYKKKTTRQKYGKHDSYSGFRQAIHEVQNPDTAMPPVTEFLPKETGDDNDDDDDIEIGGVTQDYKCPLTLVILTDPLTSTVCKHSFSAPAIREYMGNKRSVQCPASGCHKMIALGDLVPNKELAKKAKDAARRERAREESDESDDGEVIE